MKKSKIVICFLFVLSFVCCVDHENKTSNTEQKQEEKKINKKYLSLDSLTQSQKNCVKKAFDFRFDTKYPDVPYCFWEADGYLNNDEIDAVAELSLWDYYKKYKGIDKSIFLSRFKEIFGQDFDSFSNNLDFEDKPNSINGKKISENLISIIPSEPYSYFLVSKKENMIINSSSFGFLFDVYDNINSLLPPSRSEVGVQLGSSDNLIEVPHLDYLYHINNYLFNQSDSSRTWMLANDKYFMSHLLIQYGYDGDIEINKMVLKETIANNVEIVDLPTSVFHIYPNGKMKIHDNLLKAVVELSTQEESSYFEWANSIVYSLIDRQVKNEDDGENVEEDDEDYDSSNSLAVAINDYRQQLKNLSIEQKREIIAHVVNYIHPVYKSYIDENMSYGSASLDFGDLRIVDCFWNCIVNDHGMVDFIEKNNYFGLANLKSLILEMRDFQAFYNKETGGFEPWAYSPEEY